MVVKFIDVIHFTVNDSETCHLLSEDDMVMPKHVGKWLLYYVLQVHVVGT